MKRSSLESEITASETTINVVPDGAPAWVTRELLKFTLKIWQPYYEDRLTPDDALAIIQNVGALFEVFSGEVPQ